MTALMNPREYEDLIKKLRHNRVQMQSTEKTLTELRIEQASLIKEHIDRVEHGQKQGIYDAAGVTRSEVAKDLKVKDMLSNVDSNPQSLPSHSVLRIIAADSVPKTLIKDVLGNPYITVKEVKELISESKPAPAKRRPNVKTLLEQFKEMSSEDQEHFLKCVNGNKVNNSEANGIAQHFAKLNLLPTASRAQVKFTYKALALDCHSDRHGGNETQMAELNVAKGELYKHFDDPLGMKAFADAIRNY